MPPVAARVVLVYVLPTVPAGSEVVAMATGFLTVTISSPVPEKRLPRASVSSCGVAVTVSVTWPLGAVAVA